LPYAYVGSPEGIDIVELVEIDSPRVVQQIQLPGGQPEQLRLTNDTLLIAVTESHLLVLNLTSPMSPEVLLNLNLAGVSDGDLKGNYLFVVQGTYLYTYDVTSWQNPLIIDSLYWSIGFCGVTVVGDLLLAEAAYTDNCDFFIYRISYPAPLTLLNHWIPPGYFTRDYEFVDSVGVFVFDLQGVVTIQTFSLSQTDGSLTPLWSSGVLLDRDPWSLAISDSLVGIYVSRPISFALGSPASIVSGTLGPNGLLTFVDTLDLGLNRSGSVIFAHNQVDINDSTVLWCTSDGIGCGTLGEDNHVVARGFLKTHQQCLSLDGMYDTLFILTSDQLHTLDFTVTTNPDTLGSLSFVAEGVKLLDRTRLLAFDSVLTLIDISSVSELTILDTLHLGKNNLARNAVFSDSLIAVTVFGQGVLIVFQTEDSLVRASWLPVLATDVAWRGDTLLVAEMSNFMSIWNVSDPLNPVFLAYLSGQSGDSYSVSMMDSVLAASSSSFVYLYNASSVLEPILTDQEFFYGPILRHRFFDGLFYVHRSGGDFSAFDVDDSLRLRNLAAGLHGGGDATFFAHDTLVFMAAGLRGFRVLSLDTTIASVQPEGFQIPSEVRLLPNYPNPFNGQTQIEYEIPKQSNAGLEVFDLLARRVSVLSNGLHDPGRYRFVFDGSRLASGVYFYRLRSGGRLQVRTMLLQR